MIVYVKLYPEMRWRLDRFKSLMTIDDGIKRSMVDVRKILGKHDEIVRKKISVVLIISYRDAGRVVCLF